MTRPIEHPKKKSPKTGAEAKEKQVRRDRNRQRRINYRIKKARKKRSYDKSGIDECVGNFEQAIYIC